MSSSTPQGPGPEYGSNPDATPIADEDAAAGAAVDEEAEAIQDDGSPIDISDNEGPELTGGPDDDAGVV